eukprot:UN08469
MEPQYCNFGTCLDDGLWGVVFIVIAIIFIACVICWCCIFLRLIRGSGNNANSSVPINDTDHDIININTEQANEGVQVTLEITNVNNDKPLIFFSKDAGCTVHEIASTLENQSPESRVMGKLVEGSKTEQTKFVEIYTITMGLIAKTLKGKNNTSRPSQEAIKVLTKQLIQKLSKNSNGEPVLSKHNFVNNLHNILYDIHFELTDDDPSNR